MKDLVGFGSNYDQFRMNRIRRKRWTNWFYYANKRELWKGRRSIGSSVNRDFEHTNYPSLIETVNWNMRKKK